MGTVPVSHPDCFEVRILFTGRRVDAPTSQNRDVGHPSVVSEFRRGGCGGGPAGASGALERGGRRYRWS